MGNISTRQDYHQGAKCRISSILIHFLLLAVKSSRHNNLPEIEAPLLQLNENTFLRHPATCLFARLRILDLEQLAQKNQ